MAKINLKRGLTDVVLYLIIFIVVQIIIMYAGAGIWAGIKGEGYQATLQSASTGGNAILAALVQVFSSVITLIIFLKTKWTPLTRDYLLSSLSRRKALLYQFYPLSGNLLLIRLAVLIKLSIDDCLAIAHHPYFIPCPAIKDSRGS